MKGIKISYQNTSSRDGGEEPQGGFRSLSGQLYDLERMKQLQQLLLDDGTNLQRDEQRGDDAQSEGPAGALYPHLPYVRSGLLR